MSAPVTLADHCHPVPLSSNTVASADDSQQPTAVAASFVNNFPILELDSTEIFKSTAQSDYNDQSGSDTDICSEINEDVQMDRDVLDENVPTTETNKLFASGNRPIVSESRVKIDILLAWFLLVENYLQVRVSEPDTKKRRLTLTKLS